MAFKLGVKRQIKWHPVVATKIQGYADSKRFQNVDTDAKNGVVVEQCNLPRTYLVPG